MPRGQISSDVSVPVRGRKHPVAHLPCPLQTHTIFSRLSAESRLQFVHGRLKQHHTLGL